MLQGPVIILTSFGYLGLLFAIAYYADLRADRRADAGRAGGASPHISTTSLAARAPAPGPAGVASPYFYSLPLAVSATAWTFYGGGGRAAIDGVGFLPIYIG